MNDHLTPLVPTLQACLEGRLPVAALSAQWREAARLHQPALPARYHEVLERLLSQMESSALFTEESCSFSQADMLGALGDWLTKARALSTAA